MTNVMKDRQALHDLKNHLASIIGSIELLLLDTPAEDLRRADLLNIETAVRAAIALLAERRERPVRAGRSR